MCRLTVSGETFKSRAIWRLAIPPAVFMMMRASRSGSFCQYEVENVCELKLRLQVLQVNLWIRWGGVKRLKKPIFLKGHRSPELWWCLHLGFGQKGGVQDLRCDIEVCIPGPPQGVGRTYS